jgi:hypothetical protein
MVLVVVSVSAVGRLQRIFLEEEMRAANGSGCRNNQQGI